MNNEKRQRAVASLCVSGCFSFILFFFAPAQIYFTNVREYGSSFLDLSWFLIGISVLFTLFLSAMLFALNASLYQKAISLLFASSLLLWIQGNFLTFNLEVLDGTKINWREDTLRTVIDGNLWVSVLILAFAASSFFHKVAQKGSIALILIFLFSTTFLAWKAPKSAFLKKVTPFNNSFLEFSKEQNMLLLLLDGFQSDVFEEIINEDGSWRNRFEGFTYYRNMVGGYTYTFANIPLMLTGKYYDNSMPAEDFLRQVYSDQSLPTILSDNGFRIDLISADGFFADTTLFPRWARMDWLVEKNPKWRDYAVILDVALFRYLPSILKRQVYNDELWLIRNIGMDKSANEFPVGPLQTSIDFINLIDQKANTRASQPVFKFIHLWPPHIPYWMNENMRYKKSHNTRRDFKKQAIATLKLTNIFMEKLKELNVYDNTVIVIAADHGQPKKNFSEDADFSKMGSSPYATGEAVPLLLVKPFGAKGTLNISDAAACLADIPDTVSSQLGLNVKLPGDPVFEIQDCQERVRRFLSHNVLNWFLLKRPEWRQSVSLGPLWEYFVFGSPWREESWYSTYKVYTTDGVISTAPQKYHFGDPLNFAMTDSRASLTIPITDPHSGADLQVAFMPLVAAGASDVQKVRVFCDGEVIAEWIGRNKEESLRTVFIPHESLSDGAAELTFELPDWPPSDEDGGDFRPASNVALFTMELETRRKTTDNK